MKIKLNKSLILESEYSPKKQAMKNLQIGFGLGGAGLGLGITGMHILDAKKAGEQFNAENYLERLKAFEIDEKILGT